MANAKKCDICGGFFEIPEYDPRMFPHDEESYSFIRLHDSADLNNRVSRELAWLHFDACPKCYQDVLDFILSKAATNVAE
jgi:hypothetical protein